VLALGGDVILRYNSGAFPLLDVGGRSFDPLPKLRPLRIGQSKEWNVKFLQGDGRQVAARLCAVRKSPEQARRTRAKIQRKAQRNSVPVKPATLEYADFVVVLATVAASEMSLSLVLEFYRARWQVELAFKRLKSLLQMGLSSDN
jgi:hypothetical protein